MAAGGGRRRVPLGGDPVGAGTAAAGGTAAGGETLTTGLEGQGNVLSADVTAVSASLASEVIWEYAGPVTVCMD